VAGAGHSSQLVPIAELPVQLAVAKAQGRAANGGPVEGSDRSIGARQVAEVVEIVNQELAFPVRLALSVQVLDPWTGTVPGAFLGVPGNGRRISFRLLHIFEFRDGLISRENAWLDGGSIVQQLTATGPRPAVTA